MAYISRQAAIDAIINLSDVFVNNLPPLKYAVDVQDAINDVPSADVVEVVRCGACKWLIGAECVRFAEIRPRKNDFCSRGELKE